MYLNNRLKIDLNLPKHHLTNFQYILLSLLFMTIKKNNRKFDLNFDKRQLPNLRTNFQGLNTFTVPIFQVSHIRVHSAFAYSAAKKGPRKTAL